MTALVRLVAAGLVVQLAGCVVASAVGTTVDVAATAVGTTVDVATGAVDLVVPDGDDDD